MSTSAVLDRFTTLPDEHAPQATVVALERGFSVGVAADLEAASAPASRLALAPSGEKVCAGVRWPSSRRTRLQSLLGRPSVAPMVGE